MLYILRTKVRERRVWYKGEGDSEELVSYYEESGIEGRGTPSGWVLIVSVGIKGRGTLRGGVVL